MCAIFWYVQFCYFLFGSEEHGIESDDLELYMMIKFGNIV